MAQAVHAEPRHQPRRAVRPVLDQSLQGRRQEHRAHQVALRACRIEPADEQVGRRRVPRQRVPLAVQQIGRPGDGVHAGQQRGWHGRLGVVARRGAARQREQIGVLGAREPQRLGQAGQRAGGHRHRPALLQPRHPGGAKAGQLRDFLTAQARVRRRRPGGRPTSAGVRRSRCARRKAPSSASRDGDDDGSDMVVLLIPG